MLPAESLRSRQLRLGALHACCGDAAGALAFLPHHYFTSRCFSRSLSFTQKAHGHSLMPPPLASAARSGDDGGDGHAAGAIGPALPGHEVSCRRRESIGPRRFLRKSPSRHASRRGEARVSARRQADCRADGRVRTFDASRQPAPEAAARHLSARPIPSPTSFISRR